MTQKQALDGHSTFNAITLAVRPPNAFPESRKGRNVGLPSRRSSRTAVPHSPQQSLDFLNPSLCRSDPRIQCPALLNGLARKQAVPIATVRLALWCAG